MVSPAGLFCRYGPVNSCHPPCGMGVLDEKGTAGTRGSTSARPARLACSSIERGDGRDRTTPGPPRAYSPEPIE